MKKKLNHKILPKPYAEAAIDFIDYCVYEDVYAFDKYHDKNSFFMFQLLSDAVKSLPWFKTITPEALLLSVIQAPVSFNKEAERAQKLYVSLCHARLFMHKNVCLRDDGMDAVFFYILFLKSLYLPNNLIQKIKRYGVKNLVYVTDKKEFIFHERHHHALPNYASNKVSNNNSRHLMRILETLIFDGLSLLSINHGCAVTDFRLILFQAENKTGFCLTSERTNKPRAKTLSHMTAILSALLSMEMISPSHKPLGEQYQILSFLCQNLYLTLINTPLENVMKPEQAHGFFKPFSSKKYALVPCRENLMLLRQLFYQQLTLLRDIAVTNKNQLLLEDRLRRDHRKPNFFINQINALEGGTSPFNINGY